MYGLQAMGRVNDKRIVWYGLAEAMRVLKLEIDRHVLRRKGP